MIASLTGTVLAVAPTSAVVDVGGVGFLVHTPPTTASALVVGERTHLHTHLAVREDALTLFGFATVSDREAFLLVQTASGVGPKLALAILAVLDAHDLGKAIAAGNLNALVRVPGVGKKVAERLVVELKDKVSLLTALSDADAEGATPSARGEVVREQVVEGLTGLGYSSRDAERAVAAVADESPSGPEPSTAALMKAALGFLAR